MKKVLLSVFLLLSVSRFFPVLSNTDPILTAYQRDVITYFKEIALGFEYGNVSSITRKWKAPMKIFVDGTVSPQNRAELERVVAELNTLFSDGFRVEFVSSKAESNMVMFFGSRAAFAALYPGDAQTVKNASGIFRIFWTKDNYISRGHIFIHTEQISAAEQKHAIREELTQSLGLGKDSPLHQNSIFQTTWIDTNEYSDIDRQLVRLLYHPKVTVGLGAGEVEAILTDILVSAEQTL